MELGLEKSRLSRPLYRWVQSRLPYSFRRNSKYTDNSRADKDSPAYSINSDSVVQSMRLTSSGSAFGKSTPSNLETIAAVIKQSISCNRAGKSGTLNRLVGGTEIRVYTLSGCIDSPEQARRDRWEWTIITPDDQEILKPKQTILKMNVSGISLVAS
jgi:hypothetical protein